MNLTRPLAVLQYQTLEGSVFSRECNNPTYFQNWRIYVKLLLKYSVTPDLHHYHQIPLGVLVCQ